jgi:hypothetical protein
MRQVLRVAALALLGFVVLPAFAADEKKDVDKKDADKKDVDKKAPELVAAGTVTGKILVVDETKRSLKVQVNVPEINPDEARALAQAQVSLQNAQFEKNAQSRINKIQTAQRDIATHQSKLYRNKHVDVEVTTVEDVKVRMANPPAKFDEKGKVVAYTKDELKELKGDDPKQIGYKAEFSDLRANQIVQVALMKKKGTPPKPAPGEKGKDVDKADVAALAAEYAPHATMILIVMDPPAQ